MGTKYESYSGTTSIADAIDYIGHRHVKELINSPHYHNLIQHRVNGAWRCHNLANYQAYCAIMQAGQAAVKQAIDQAKGDITLAELLAVR